MRSGIQPISFRLQNTLLFKDVTWKFKPGLSVIYGLNRASARTSSNGNGAGKSAFFSMIGETVYECPVIGEKQDALKTGTRTYDFLLHGKPVQIVREGSKLDIKINGKSKFRTKPKARKWLEKNFPVNQEEYETYLHIDGRLPHPLAMGSSTTRKKFFNTFFGLDKMDIERRLFQAELAKLGKVRAAYDEIRTEFIRAKEKKESTDKDALKQSIVECQAELDELNAKNSRLQNITQLLAFEKSAMSQIKAYLDLDPEVSQDAFDELLEIAKWNKKTNKADLAEAHEWRQYQRDTKHYTDAYEQLSNGTKKLIVKLGKKGLLDKYGDAADKARNTKLQIKEWKSSLEEAQATLSAPKPKKVEIDPEWDRKAILSKISALEHQYDHAKKFKSGQCEACGQDVVVKDPETIKARYKKEKVKVRLLDEHDDYQETIKQRKAARKIVDESAEALEELEAQYDKYSKRAKAVAEVRELPKKPIKFEGKKLDVPILERMCEEDQERLILLDFIQPNLDTIREITKLTEKQRKASSIADKLQIKINEVQERLGKLRLKWSLAKEAFLDYKRLRERVVEMKTALRDEKALKLLVEGYSDKQMKKTAIKTIASRLMQEVNKYGRIVFPEDYTFDFNWDKSNMALIVHRKHGKKMLVSDVRKLSGAESKLFTIVLVMALMTFVPQRKRCTSLILDEPASTFSLETLDSLKRLLPVLNKLFPSIILITPRTDERYEGAMEFTVLKEKVATILEGHPSMHKVRKQK